MKKRFISSRRLEPHLVFFSRMGRRARAVTWLMTAAGYWCCVYDLYAAQCIRQPAVSHHGSSCLHPQSIYNIKNAQLSAGGGTFFEKHHRRVWGGANMSRCWSLNSVMCQGFHLSSSIVGSIQKGSVLPTSSVRLLIPYRFTHWQVWNKWKKPKKH